MQHLPPTASYHCKILPLTCPFALANPIFTCSRRRPRFFINHHHHQHAYELANGGMNMNMNMMGGKGVFTRSQLEELERQKMIHKYILASIPVPPQLLLLLSAQPPSQCNTSMSMELRYPTSGSDPEPWRCKRTDGKKWRCSRDVAPDQKYCERHAHKNRPRSRKHEELNTNTRSSPYHQPQPQPTRCMEWLMRGQDMSKQQQHQLMPSSSPSPSISDNDNHLSVYHPLPHFAEKQAEAAASTKEKTLWASSSLNLSMSMCGGEWINNPISWMNCSSPSAPGGPLGEALRLGKGGNGSGNSSRISNTKSSSSSCSKSSSSCEDASHALNFIGSPSFH